ncbi:hypothetical protein EII25_02605 [Erysipelotrichaceae bacterium OH741_COT-311]|nr:hypothetical protein EII25_02605 [Erysipelotrichaceae bacterium OH741_COT-311]
MKKLTILLTSLLILSGCGKNASANISFANDELLTVGNTKITKGEIYQTLKNSGSSFYIIEEATDYFIEKEITNNDALMEKALGELENIKKLYGDNFSSIISSYGYASEEEFVKNTILQQLQVQELNNVYLNENLQTYLDSYLPKKAQIMTFDNLDTAQNAYVALTEGKDFKEIASQMNSSSNPDELIYTSKSLLASPIKFYLDKAETVGLSEVLIDAENTKYYLVNITSVDPTTYKDEFIESIAHDQEVVQSALSYYFKKYNFTLYDIDIYQQFKESYPTYLNQKEINNKKVNQ